MKVPLHGLLPVFLQAPSPVIVPLVSSHLSVKGMTPAPLIPMSPEVQRSPAPCVRVQPLFGQLPPNAVMLADAGASEPMSMCAATRTFGQVSLSDEKYGSEQPAPGVS